MSTISLANDVTVSTPDPLPAAGEEVVLWESAEINNQNFSALMLDVEFKSLAPAGVLGSFHLVAEVEYQDADGNWRNLPVYQSNSLRKSEQAMQRILIMQPGLNVQNLGEADIQYRGPYPVCETYRHAGTVPETKLRARVMLIDEAPTDAARAFQQVTINAELTLS